MSATPLSTSLDVERAVGERYTRAARTAEAGLCCPVPIDPRRLEAVPEEILARDYGCGDPAAHVHPGEVVIDLGSGAGKACYLLSQVVGAGGRVIGVDFNDSMLALARAHQAAFAARLGFDNLRFVKGRVQDLALDLEALDRWLAAHPVSSSAGLADAEREASRLRRDAPLIGDESVDVVVSDCVLNLVRAEDKQRLFGELHRVLKRGGRVVISDIVSDEPVSKRLQEDPVLWSGCVSGALPEVDFLRAFEDAGFYGIELLDRPATPWRTIDGVEFRSVTVAAYKGKEGPCWDRRQAVLYQGPFREVQDDDGHVLRRGVPLAVCDKTFQLYSRSPYAGHVALVEPLCPVPLEDARPFDCGAAARARTPRETKGEGYAATSQTAACCAEGSCVRPGAPAGAPQRHDMSRGEDSD